MFRSVPRRLAAAALTIVATTALTLAGPSALAGDSTEWGLKGDSTEWGLAGDSTEWGLNGGSTEWGLLNGGSTEWG